MSRAPRPADRRTHLPQLVVTATGYRVFDPGLVTGPGQTQESSGRIARGPSDADVAFWLIAAVLFGGAAPLLFAGSILGAVLWGAAGFIAGFVLAVVVSTSWDPESHWRAAHPGREPEEDVAWDHPAHGLCRLAARIADTAAWRDRIVDPDRRLATIVWSAVTAVRDHRDDAATATDLAETEGNLRGLLDVARDLDRRRDHGDDPASHLRARHARRLSDELLDTGRLTRDLA